MIIVSFLQLQITASDQAKPGDAVTLNIKTDPESYVGLLAVDQSVLLLQAGNDFNEQEIFNDLKCFDSESLPKSSCAGRGSGFVTLTNACHHPQMSKFKF